MRRACRLSILTLTMVLLGIVAGCGPRHSATVPVTGTVTLDGKPLAGVGVLFSPDSQGRPASGVTDASGNFILQTYAPGDGAIAGTYYVAIAPSPKPAGSGAKGAAKKPGIPSKYTLPETSGFVVKVDDPMEPVTLGMLSE